MVETDDGGHGGRDSVIDENGRDTVKTDER
jgi:hypothetical protein